MRAILCFDMMQGKTDMKMKTVAIFGKAQCYPNVYIDDYFFNYG